MSTHAFEVLAAHFEMLWVKLWLPLDSNIEDLQLVPAVDVLGNQWEPHHTTLLHVCVLLLFLFEASGERVHAASDVCLPSAASCCHYRYLSWLKSTVTPLEKRRTSELSALTSILKALQREAVSHDSVWAPSHRRSHCPGVCTWSRKSGCIIARLHYLS